MFPDSYNYLRQELYDNWSSQESLIPNLWQRVGYYMAFDMAAFIEEMNTALDGCLRVMPVAKTDEEFCDLVCLAFLTELRKRRGELNP
jgi:hypothetical protein